MDNKGQKRANLFIGKARRSMNTSWDDPRKLNDAPLFDHGLRLKQDYDKARLLELLDLSGYKLDDKLRDLDILLANLLSNNERCIAVPMGAEHWTESQYRVSSYFTVNLIKQFDKLGLIDMKNGYLGKSESRYTRIQATERLREICPVLPSQVLYSPVNLMEVRDWNGKLLPYNETAKTRAVKKKLQRINTVNAAADIRKGAEVYKAHLIAIYKLKTTLYGRLHTKGFHHVQGLSEDERAELTINGDPVCELDFSALHPNLLYSWVGIQYQGDPYQVIHPDPLTRPFLKQLLLYLLNSKDFIQAERAGNNWLFEHRKEKRELQRLGITKARPLLKAFIEVHQPISQYFCSGKETGLRIMNKDAQICLDIVHDFATQVIPILSVHDSFIVQQQFRDRLYATMQERYYQHTKGYEIGIK